MPFFFSDFLYKSICCGYSFELHRQVHAIQMGTHNICLYKEVDKKYNGCSLKTMQLLDCALTGICATSLNMTISQHYDEIKMRALLQNEKPEQNKNASSTFGAFYCVILLIERFALFVLFCCFFCCFFFVCCCFFLLFFFFVFM